MWCNLTCSGTVLARTHIPDDGCIRPKHVVVVR
jgi:hypothetical protein